MQRITSRGIFFRTCRIYFRLLLLLIVSRRMPLRRTFANGTRAFCARSRDCFLPILRDLNCRWCEPIVCDASRIQIFTSARELKRTAAMLINSPGLSFFALDARTLISAARERMYIRVHTECRRLPLFSARHTSFSVAMTRERSHDLPSDHAELVRYADFIYDLAVALASRVRRNQFVTLVGKIGLHDLKLLSGLRLVYGMPSIKCR